MITPLFYIAKFPPDTLPRQFVVIKVAEQTLHDDVMNVCAYTVVDRSPLAQMGSPVLLRNKGKNRAVAVGDAAGSSSSMHTESQNRKRNRDATEDIAASPLPKKQNTTPSKQPVGSRLGSAAGNRAPMRTSNTVDLVAVVLSEPSTTYHLVARQTKPLTQVWAYTATAVVVIKAWGSDILDGVEVGTCYSFTRMKRMQIDYTVSTDTTVRATSPPPALPLEFAPLADIRDGDKNKAIIGVVIDCGKVTLINKEDKEYTLRNIVLAGDGVQVTMVLWGTMASSFTAGVGDVFATNNAMVKVREGSEYSFVVCYIVGVSGY